MNDIYQTLRTVCVTELTCQQYDTSVFKKNFGTYNVNTRNLAVVLASDDIGCEEGDYESIRKMHRLLMTHNTLFKVLEFKERAIPAEDNNYYCWYCYLVATENPDYLTDFFSLVHMQSKMDKAQYKFEEKYDVVKKRKFGC